MYWKLAKSEKSKLISGQVNAELVAAHSVLWRMTNFYLLDRKGPEHFKSTIVLVYAFRNFVQIAQTQSSEILHKDSRYKSFIKTYNIWDKYTAHDMERIQDVGKHSDYAKKQIDKWTK